MTPRRPVSLGAVLFVLVASVSVSAQQAPLTLEEAERLAVATHPALKEAGARVEAARGHLEQAGAWQNPMVGYSATDLRVSASDPTGVESGFVEQTIPLGGKLRSAANEAASVVARDTADVATVRQQVVNDVRVRYYELLAANRRLEVETELAQLFQEASTVTARLFNVGAADRPDVLESELEARRVQMDLDAARTRQDAAWHLLAISIGDPGATARPLALTLDDAIPALDRAETLAAVLRDSPVLAAATAEGVRARATADREKTTTRPDLFLSAGLGWDREHGDGGLLPVARGLSASFEAGLSVPVFNTNRGGIAAASAEVTAADAAVATERLTLETSFTTEFERYAAATAQARAYKADILPTAEEAYRLYLANFGAMTAAYPQVLVAQRSLLQATADYVQALDDAWRAALRLQGFLVGAAADAGEE